LPSDAGIARPDKLLLTVNEVAELLSLSVRTVHKLVASDRLATVRIGRCVRFSRTALDDFVREHAGGARRLSWDDAPMVRALSTSAGRAAGAHRSGSALASASPPMEEHRRRHGNGSQRRSTRTPEELRRLAARIASASS
jgi:excisionase family DNA binding protein